MEGFIANTAIKRVSVAKAFKFVAARSHLSKLEIQFIRIERIAEVGRNCLLWTRDEINCGRFERASSASEVIDRAVCNYQLYPSFICVAFAAASFHWNSLGFVSSSRVKAAPSRKRAHNKEPYRKKGRLVPAVGGNERRTRTDVISTTS